MHLFGTLAARDRAALFLGSCLILAFTQATHANVSIGPYTIIKGTTIEIVGPYTGLDLQAIIDGITDASASKPYSIELGAGEYDLGTNQIVMTPFVSIRGVGQAATFITSSVSDAGGSLSGSDAVIVGASNVELSDLSVVNNGSGASSVGMFNNSASPRIQDVTITASGATDTRGIYNYDESSPVMTNVTIEVSGGTDHYGLFNYDESSPMITNLTATASGGAKNYAVFSNLLSDPVMVNVKASASGGSTENRAVYISRGKPVLWNVDAVATGTASYGVWIFFGTADTAPRIEHSSVSGGTAGIRFSGSNAERVANTRIVGGVANDDGLTTVQCRNTYDAILNNVNC